MRLFLAIKRNHLLGITLFLVLIAMSLFVEGQEVKLETKVDKSTILIGDHINLKHKLVFNPTQFRVQLPILTDTFNRFEMVERKQLDTTAQGEQIILTQENIITHFDSGQYIIPAQLFTVTPLDGSPAYEIASDSIPILVHTIDADTSQPIKPIYDIIAAEKPWWETPLYIGLTVLVMLLIGGLVYYYLRRLRNKKREPNVTKKVYVLPWDNALQMSASLISKKLWLANQEKMHHTQLTDILRTYIEDGFGIDCFEKTSQEIITDVKKYLQKNKYKKRSEELDKLRTIFFTADLVKFAKSKPTELEHEQSNQALQNFVNSTKGFLAQMQQKENKQSN